MQYQSLTSLQVSAVRQTVSAFGFSVRQEYSGSISIRPRKGKVLTVGLAKQVAEHLDSLGFIELSLYQETFNVFFALETEMVLSEQFFSGLFAKA